jgi:hypothetical protein
VADPGLWAELASVGRFLHVLDPADGSQQPIVFGELSVTDSALGFQ